MAAGQGTLGSDNPTEESDLSSESQKTVFREVTRSDLCLARELCLQWRGGSWPGGEETRGEVDTVAQAGGDGDLTQGGAAKPREQEA